MVIDNRGPQQPDDLERARHDPRLLENGSVIQASGYSDQPYVVVTGSGTWLCVVTSSDAHEGDSSQRIVARTSTDRGQTWTAPVDIEPADGPEASWAVPLITPAGRVYVFYTYNTLNIREVPTDTGTSPRVDTLGDMVFRYSDDEGESWSDRHTVPIRAFDIDKRNPFGGEVQFWWSVGKPEVVGSSVFIAASKVGEFREESQGFQKTSEGFLLRSDDILFASDPATITWQTLPDGDVGLRAPEGEVAEEHKVVGLRDGSLYCVYRSEKGYVASSSSRDGGHTWSAPAWATFASGRPIKNPRAATFAWSCGEGRHLLWFHNNSNTWFGTYRNPVWLSGGIEVDGTIAWSEPEIVLYADDPQVSMSYPDLVQHDGAFWLTETQKKVARVHEIDRDLLARLWGEPSPHLGEGIVAQYRHGDETPVSPFRLTPFQLRRGNWRIEEARAGFTLSVDLTVVDTSPGRTIVDDRDASGRGFAVEIASRGRLRFTMSDGRRECSWTSDADTIVANKPTHVGVVVDGGPKIILFVVDGVLQDGGDERPYGWGRFSDDLRDVNSDHGLDVHGLANHEVGALTVFDRALRVAEVGELAEDARRRHAR
ncbi:exo-alpha-sialidase [Herbiconiux ginsengi]|uniref:exo-alpha-sialidase n=1 Tax=Herbiconiux ginsengi TaxID=381665 RepID=A0A1H3LHI0_9MICO|nr:exo-alpha-sialidase [Herbiconiux ginsengi]SDY63766.1 BNR repeat-like domain-containing protein [Herbiconiux ginsengi]